MIKEVPVMYAIIATGGKQYKVAEGDIIRVEKLGAGAGSKVCFDKVLVINGDEMTVGAPYIEGANVTATVTKEGKAKKVIVYKYKRKTGYHKKNGHRQLFTEVKIEEILSKGQSSKLNDAPAKEAKAEETQEVEAKAAAKKPARKTAAKKTTAKAADEKKTTAKKTTKKTEDK